MNTFRFKFKPPPPMSLKWRQTDPYIPSNIMNIASESRADDKKKIVDALLDQHNNVGLTVLPIVGMGGMGKTTLAQLVYNDTAIQKHFQVRLWLCVSENFDVDSLAQRIVKEIKANDSEENGNSAPNKPKSAVGEEKANGRQENGNSASEKLESAVKEAEANSRQENRRSELDKHENAISKKRYLLILDDVWNREANKWEKLKSYLPHGGTGSSVVTTTRDDHVAQFMGTIKAHKIKGLDLNILEEIIKTGAFGSPAKVPTEFKILVRDIANRCKRSPLAATALGSVLRTKNTVKEWEVVLNQSKICDEENGILPILKLSYNCLPPHMRQCFAFCAMFPKDHEIDVEMLIQLWMANCFIPEQKEVCPEVTGKQIFNELAQRSFFQDVKQDRFCRQITCKIHDLMHDVAQDSMGKECATVDTEVSQSEDFPYTARHLFVSVDIPGNVLNASIQEGSSGFQTLICDRSTIQDLQHLSKYRSIRALNTQQGSFLGPKYLHHLRYLDLSGSDIKALPEDITILYHLQTLNLSYCQSLEQLPKTMKYMTAIRHLYTHGCDELKSMPPNLGHLTSLQTLTCFVLGTGSSCSNLGELVKLDLGGHLELKQLENVTGPDAKAAELWDKKRLEELTLRWSDDYDEQTDKEMLEGLRPHDGLKAMRMYCCMSSGIPTWILELQGMVELKLENCQNLEKLPALWQLPSLQFLYLRDLQNLHCLFSGGAPSKFQKLKGMQLTNMPKFETWWDTTEVQGEEALFPEVESLRIWGCGSLTALPKASMVRQCSGKDDTECRSAFPALRQMWLLHLEKFHRWEAVDGTVGEHVTFPQLEKLEIRNCSGLTTFPEAPKLSTLELNGCSEDASLQAASRYFHSLSSMSLETSCNSYYNKEENSIEVVVCGHESPCLLGDLVLIGCNLFFSHSSAAALWKCFGQLSELEISGCDALVYWPENLFQGLVSLRMLRIESCSKLTGLTEDESSGEQSAPGWSGGHLPRLESLVIRFSVSLVHVPNQLLSAASLKTLHMEKCDSLKSVVFGEQQQEDTRRLQVSGKGGVVQPEETSSSLIAAGSSSSSEVASLSTAVVLKPVSSTSASSSNHCFFPCLEFLYIYRCRGLIEVANLPPSIKTLKIRNCSSLVSLSGEVASLEELTISFCDNLKSLPNGPHQVYSSLRVLSIYCCNVIKQLAPSLRLQQRENHLDEKDPDSHLQEQVELDSKPESMSDGASTAVVLTQSSSTSSDHSVFPCLESLYIYRCRGLTEVPNLPPTIKTLKILCCPSLVTLSGEVLSLEEFVSCQSLESLPKAYSSLRVVRIRNCGGIKQLPPSLQQSLDHLEEKDLDPHLLQGPAEPVPTGRIAALMSKLECFRSRSED